MQVSPSRAPRPFRFATMRLGKKSEVRMLVEICAPVAQMDQSGRFLNLFNVFF